MRKLILFFTVITFFACKELSTKKKFIPEMQTRSRGLVGMQYGGSIKDDSSMYMGTYSYSAIRRGREIGFGFWRVCTTGVVFDSCRQIIDVASLDTQLNDQNVRVVVETKFPPKDSLVGTSCQDSQHREVLGWIDPTNPDRRKAYSAWRVSDSLLKFVSVPPESVNCFVEENANEGESEN